MLKKLGLVLFLCFVTIFMTGCGKNDFVGTWELKSNVDSIDLASSENLPLDTELVITKDDLSKTGSCAGSTCKKFIYSGKNFYYQNLCYKLVDKNTLKQVACKKDTIAGYSNMEMNEHDVSYVRISE